MPEDAFLTCVYYFSLPEFPDNCRIVKDNNLFVRDVLVSNPSNPHVRYGGQYDPHYEHALAPEFKMCSKKTRKKIMSIVDAGSCERIYLLFRTTRTLLSKTNIHYVTGYYDVDMDKVCIDPNYEEPVIYAKEARFLDLKSAINISDFLLKTNYYQIPFSSETKEGSFRELLYDWMEHIQKEQNFLNDYINVTKRLDGLFQYNEYEESKERGYPICDNCANIDECPLIRRIHKKGKLYHQLPRNIADTINSHHKRVIRL